MKYIIAIMGPSQSGKTFLVQRIMDNACDGFTPRLISKQTNRELREDEKDALKHGLQIDVQPVKEFTADLMYQTYGKRTGTTIAELIEIANHGETPIVIINDVIAMSKLKRECVSRDSKICVISIFLFRRIPIRSEYFEESKKRGNVSDEETEQRFDKAKTLYRIYIENMYIFDYVIVNAIHYAKEEIDLKETIVDKQIKAIRDCIIKKNIRPFARHERNKPLLYVITGNAASGKDELIRATYDLGKLYAETVPKYTSRNQGSDDGTEMICKYIISEKYIENIRKEAECLKADVIQTLQKINELNVKYNAWMKNKGNDESGLYDTGIKTYPWWALLDKVKNMNFDIQEIFPWADRAEIDPPGYELNPVYEKLRPLFENQESKEFASRFITYIANGRFNYFIDLQLIRDGLNRGKSQVIVLSDWTSIDKLKKEFGEQVIVIFCHSQISEDEFTKKAKGTAIADKRENFRKQLDDYAERFCDYRHVIIYGENEIGHDSDGRQEELIDQLFKLFHAYEQKWL